jgi:hypothetical protein
MQSNYQTAEYENKIAYFPPSAFACLVEKGILPPLPLRKDQTAQERAEDKALPET